MVGWLLKLWIFGKCVKICLMVWAVLGNFWVVFYIYIFTMANFRSVHDSVLVTKKSSVVSGLRAAFNAKSFKTTIRTKYKAKMLCDLILHTHTKQSALKNHKLRTSMSYDLEFVLNYQWGQLNLRLFCEYSPWHLKQNSMITDCQKCHYF